ncbi:hypothetical protein [Burkholderia ubonensis]|uniref:hypothetical protein n=2 Tax=Burkholderia ubonensis TaxID=101571 RepID=UPI0018DF2408|nr:hypothetical protein [Burkholderia ubonensis]
MRLNNVRNKAAFGELGGGYVMYHGWGGWDGIIYPEWNRKEDFTADVELSIDNSVVKDWPAISVRAGNFTDGTIDVGETTGGAYISSVDGGANPCKVIDPTLPPPPPVSISVDVAAPDWNLGELPQGEGKKTLGGSAQQLCFTYSGLDSSQRFVINATNANGVTDNRYLLKNASKPTQTVPYSLTLDSGSATFPLPNISSSPVTLNQGNRTCFTPTFMTSVDKAVEEGDYSDVLSFTVVTKS